MTEFRYYFVKNLMDTLLEDSRNLRDRTAHIFEVRAGTTVIPGTPLGWGTSVTGNDLWNLTCRQHDVLYAVAQQYLAREAGGDHTDATNKANNTKIIVALLNQIIQATGTLKNLVNDEFAPGIFPLGNIGDMELTILPDLEFVMGKIVDAVNASKEGGDDE